MAWNLLASLIPTGVSMVSQYMNKPKEGDYAPDTSYMDKYISSLRGRSQDQQVYQQTMRPMLRTIGRQGEAMRKQGQYSAARGGYEGTGIEGQMALSRQQQLLGAYTSAGEKASAAQLQESRRLGDKAEQAIAQRGQAVAQGEKAFQKAKEQWTRGLVETGVKGIASVATAGLKQGAAEATAAAKTAKGATSAYEKANAAGLTGGLTEEGFIAASENAGYKNPTIYTEFLKTQAGITAKATKTAEELTTSLRKGYDEFKVEPGSPEMPFEEYRAEFEKGEWSDTGSFNKSLKGVAPYEPPKEQLTIGRNLRKAHKDVDIVQEINEHYGTTHTTYEEAINDPTVASLAPIERKLKGEVSVGEQKIEGKEASIQFTGRLSNLKQQIKDAGGEKIAANPEVDSILKDLETTGYITAENKVKLHEYAQTLSTKIKAGDKILWADLGTGETHKVTGAKVYSQLKSEIDAMQISEDVKTIPKVAITKEGKGKKVVKKVGAATTTTSEEGEKKPVEETHPPGYDESKGWSMEIVEGTRDRMYTKPDGSIILTDLEGNVIGTKDAVEEAKVVKDEKEESVKEVIEKTDEEVVEEKTTEGEFEYEGRGSLGSLKGYVREGDKKVKFETFGRYVDIKEKDGKYRTVADIVEGLGTPIQSSPKMTDEGWEFSFGVKHGNSYDDVKENKRTHHYIIKVPFKKGADNKSYSLPYKNAVMRLMNMLAYMGGVDEENRVGNFADSSMLSKRFYAYSEGEVWDGEDLEFEDE